MSFHDLRIIIITKKKDRMSSSMSPRLIMMSIIKERDTHSVYLGTLFHVNMIRNLSSEDSQTDRSVCNEDS